MGLGCLSRRMGGQQELVERQWRDWESAISERFRKIGGAWNLNILIFGGLGKTAEPIIVDGKNKTSLSGESLSELSYCKGGWVCKYDVARAFVKAVNTAFSGHHLINIIGSYQAADLFDISTAKDLLGFECKEKFL